MNVISVDSSVLGVLSCRALNRPHVQHGHALSDPRQPQRRHHLHGQGTRDHGQRQCEHGKLVVAVRVLVQRERGRLAKRTSHGERYIYIYIYIYNITCLYVWGTQNMYSYYSFHITAGFRGFLVFDRKCLHISSQREWKNVNIYYIDECKHRARPINGI